VKKSARLIKFSSFRQGGVTDVTGYGVQAGDNASSDGDVRYSSDNVMIIILKLKKRVICHKSALLSPPTICKSMRPLRE
jgi:hypothetical protein